MQAGAAGSALTAMLFAGMPADAALTLIPCPGCQLSRTAPRDGNVEGHRAVVQSPGMRFPHEEMLHAGQWTAKGLTDRWARHVFGADGSAFSIETVRRIARRATVLEPMRAPRDTLSMGSATLRYRSRMGFDDSVSLGLTAGMEKRRFALDLAGGHHIRSQTVGLVADWSHGTAWRLETGYRFDFGSRPATMLERGIELAEGAGRSQRGAWTALSYRIGPSDAGGGMTVGLRAQSFRLTEDDRIALGASGRTDNRMTLTTSFRFN